MHRLDGPRFGPAAGGKARQLVVLLHGVGADGADLIAIAAEWARVLPHAAFVAPDGPQPCDMGPPGPTFGRQWFSLADRSPAAMEAGIRAAAPVVGEFLKAELAALGLEPSALALMGFSQGAMTALFVGLRGAPAPAAILAYSGALLAPASLGAEMRQRPPVLLVHGDADGIVPVAASRAAQAALAAAGVPVEALYPRGLAHGIDAAGLAAGAALLAGLGAAS